MSTTKLAITPKSQKLEKAYLSIVPPDSSQPLKPSSGKSKTLTFRFNPREYTIRKTTSWAEITSPTAKNAGPRQWQGTGPRTMSLELLLDASDSATGSVVDDTETLFSCCSPVASSGQKPSSAPYVMFGWGGTTGFLATVTSVAVRYTMFRPDGTPYRAVARVELREYEVEASRQNPTSGGTASIGAYTFAAGDSLASIAYREYGDPGLWRAIAEHNAIDDPMRIRPGQQLLLPAFEELPQHAEGAAP